MRDTGVPTPVEFNRDIRPILSDKCYTCHGPDQARRRTKLRFDIEADAKQDLGGRFAIVPGDPAKSEMMRRITAAEPARRMPPEASGRTLTDREIDTIQRWIEQGAKWENHWSFMPPRRARLPETRNRTWSRNAIDPFVLERLEQEGLTPSPEADRATLIRRVSLDLTGLPPTPAEVDAFLTDNRLTPTRRSSTACCASPRYGERMAARWLDAARYADTNGYQTDGERYMWRWRDWVIDAFNRNLPFDQFTLEQLAGDLLPNATLDQKIATGFNRNHRGNGEGGIIPEEYAVEYVVDRVETTSTVWLGLTLGCARCHDHKYDPFTQKEFYQLFAYFNNVPERGKAIKYGNSPPMIQAPTVAQQAQLNELDRELAAAAETIRKPSRGIGEAQRSWEVGTRQIGGARLVDSSRSRRQLSAGRRSDTSGLAHARRARLRLHTAPRASCTDRKTGAARRRRAAEFRVRAHRRGRQLRRQAFILGRRRRHASAFRDKFTLAAWIYPTADTGAIITRTKDVEEETGYGLYLKDGKVQANLILRWLDDGARVETVKPIALNRWQHVMMTYDGSRTAEGIKIYVDGQSQELAGPSGRPESELPVARAAADRRRRRARRTGSSGRSMTCVIYSVALIAAEAAVVATGESISEIAAIASGEAKRGAGREDPLYFLENQSPARIQRGLARDRRQPVGEERASSRAFRP